VSQRGAFFDLDKTVIAKSSTLAFASFEPHRSQALDGRTVRRQDAQIDIRRFKSQTRKGLRRYGTISPADPPK
jgi:hypothetical protein